MKTTSIKLLVIFIVLFLIFVKSTFVKSAPDQSFEPKEAEEEFILFIVDFSNSMSEKLHGTSKINMVLDTMQELIPNLPPEKRVGLRVYGHKGGFVLPNAACKASSLIVPMSKNMGLALLLNSSSVALPASPKIGAELCSLNMSMYLLEVSPTNNSKRFIPVFTIDEPMKSPYV